MLWSTGLLIMHLHLMLTIIPSGVVSVLLDSSRTILSDNEI